jgi:hypothetical protein
MKKRTLTVFAALLSGITVVAISAQFGLGSGGPPDKPNGALAAPTGTSPTGDPYNNTHWKVVVGATIHGTILNVTPALAQSSVPVIVKHDGDNRTVDGAVSNGGATVSFDFTVPSEWGPSGGQCSTSIVAFIADGNNTNNSLIPGGNGTSSAGFAITDKKGTCKSGPDDPALVSGFADGSGPVIGDGPIGSVDLGSTVSDSAHVSNDGGLNGTPQGTVNFTFFTNGTCSGAGSPAGSNINVNGSGDAGPSTPQGPLAAGSYSFRADYTSSDPTKWTSVSPGGCETFTVDKITPGLSTTLVGDSFTLGSSVGDSSSLTGQVSGFPIGGSVTYTLYTGGCDSTNSSKVTTVTVATDASVPNSDPSGALPAGDYHYAATLAPGDTANYNSATAACEPFTINKGTVDISTKVLQGETDVTGTTLPLGSSVTDSATITRSPDTFEAAGTVSYTLYKGDCTDTSNPIGTSPSGSLGAGHYFYIASYAGDPNYADNSGVCEPFRIDKGTLAITTKVMQGDTDVTGTALPLGSAVTDTSDVTGAIQGFDLGGTVTYTLYKGDCTDTSHPVGTSPSGQLGAGHYFYIASYAGDPNYNDVSAQCEPFTINKGTAGLTTTVHIGSANGTVVPDNGPVPLGTSVVDTASLTGSPIAPTGTPTFALYKGACGLGTLYGSGAAQGPLPAGAYYFIATYSGDSNYDPKAGDCEPFTVNTGTLSSFTTKVLFGTTDVTNKSVTDGSSVHDSATAVGVTGVAPTGTVTFTFFTNGTCTPSGAAAGTHLLNASGLADGSLTEGPLAAGSYSFLATYGGDANYAAVDAQHSTCEPFTVVRIPLSPGYWKNHPQDPTYSHLPVSLGNYLVDTTQKAINVINAMNCNNANGAISCLAGQLMATTLNLLAGTNACLAVTTAKTAANTLLSTAPPNGVLYTGPVNYNNVSTAVRNQALTLKSIFDAYNNNQLTGC